MSDNSGNRCQPKKEHDTHGFLSRSEVRLALTNLVLAATISSVVVVSKMTWGAQLPVCLSLRSHSRLPSRLNNPTGRRTHTSIAPGALGYGKIYVDVSEFGYGWLVVSTVLYFLWIDLWAYVAHRALHFPVLYKAVHKVHHVYKQPTAFSGLGLHPVDMVFLQAGVYTVLIFSTSWPCPALIPNLLPRLRRYTRFRSMPPPSPLTCCTSITTTSWTTRASTASPRCPGNPAACRLPRHAISYAYAHAHTRTYTRTLHSNTLTHTHIHTTKTDRNLLVLIYVRYHDDHHQYFHVNYGTFPDCDGGLGLRLESRWL